jgi:Cdc6-like AAA superfamily ATPase
MLKSTHPHEPISIFISYAHEDEKLCERLIVHLANLQDQGVIAHWYDGRILPGQLWDDTIKAQLASAKIILLLVSADFLASRYVKDVELPAAIGRHEAQQAYVVPVILSPCDWQNSVLGKLEALPTDGKPITTWHYREQAWLSVVEGLRSVLNTLSVSPVPGIDGHERTRVEQRLPVASSGIFRYLLDYYFPSLHRFLTRLGTLGKPAETDVLNNYLRDARANIENDIRHKTYIPPSGKEVLSTPLQSGPSTDPFVPPMQRVIRQIMGRDRGGDSASAQIAAVNRSSRVIRNIITTLLRSADPLVLLGDPGTGKTMTLQQAAMVLFESQIKRVFPIVTLYVRLGEFYVEGRVTPEHVWHYVKASASPQISPYLEALDSAGRLIVLFDGMDEMSRERYSEHTEALSIFAASRKGRTKTLFSCRITDFSPKFMHRRLVLLPFSSEQISEYLRRYIRSFPLTIEGEGWSLKRLVKRLLSGSLPLEATNPFVLWLLCFQLQQKGSWPASRVELLRFYIEENYRRKAEDLDDDEEPFPPVDQALGGWSQIAYTITNLNRGAAIAVPTLTAEVNLDVEELIRVGKRCGIFQESLNEEERQIRFEHHRFQEFFTALFINQRQPAIAWLDKLDAPRWQETMVNVILMGGGEDAIRTLADAIENEIEPATTFLAVASVLNNPKYALQRYEPAPDYDPTASQDQLDPETRNKQIAEIVASKFSPQAETVVADRIELASRIVRQAGSSSRIADILLTGTLERAVSFLSEYGNPITQVKMMRACQNVPTVDIFEVLQNSLKSPINWVRNQALIIVSSSNRGPVAVGSHFATELGYDLANGLFPLRLKAYVKAAAASRRARNWWCFAVGTFCFLLNVTLLLAFAAPLHLLGWEILSDPQVPVSIGSVVYVATGALLTTAAIGVSLKFEPGKLWIAILAPAAAIVLLPWIMFSVTQGLGAVLTTVILLAMTGSLVTALIAIPIALGIHFIALSIYLAATAPVRHSAVLLRSYFSATWRNCGFRENFFARLKFGGKFLMYALLGASPLIVYKGISLLSDLSHLPFSLPVNLLVILIAFALVSATLIALVQRQISVVPTVFKYIFGGAAAIAAAIGGIYILVRVWGWLLKKLNELTLPISALLVQLLGIVIMLALTAGLVYTLWLFRRRLQILILWRKHQSDSRAIAPDSWKQQLTSADPDLQLVLLNRTNHQTLGLEPQQFLRVLEDIQDLITEEPALSSYWEKRDRLEQVLRQERQG